MSNFNQQNQPQDNRGYNDTRDSAEIRRVDPYVQDISARDVRQGRRGSQTFAVLVLSLLLGAAAITGLIMWSATTPDQASLQNDSAISTGTVPRPIDRTPINETIQPSSNDNTQAPAETVAPPAQPETTQTR